MTYWQQPDMTNWVAMLLIVITLLPSFEMEINKKGPCGSALTGARISITALNSLISETMGIL